MKRGILLCFTLLLLGGPIMARETVIVADAVLPGFGAFYAGHYVPGIAIATGRIGTAYLSWYYDQRAREYRSAEKAARIAELYFGPGYRFKNPYGGGYYTASEYNRLSGKRKLYSNLGLLVHFGLAIGSGLLTASWIDEAMPPPVFPMPEARDQPLSFTIRLTF